MLELTSPGTQYMWITAVRTPGADDPPNRAVVCAPRRWKVAELEELLLRLGCDPREDAARVVVGTTSVRELASEFVRRCRSLAPAAYVEEAYRAILGRGPDADGLTFYAKEIEEGIQRFNIVDCLIASPEFDAIYRQEDAEPDLA